MSSSINISDIERIYTDTDGKAVQALKNVDLDIRAGEFISLMANVSILLSSLPSLGAITVTPGIIVRYDKSKMP